MDNYTLVYLCISYRYANSFFLFCFFLLLLIFPLNHCLFYYMNMCYVIKYVLFYHFQILILSFQFFYMNKSFFKYIYCGCLCSGKGVGRRKNQRGLFISGLYMVLFFLFFTSTFSNILYCYCIHYSSQIYKHLILCYMN